MNLDGAWESMFWAVFQTSTNPIVVLDDQEQIVEINDAALAPMAPGASRQWGRGTRSDRGFGRRPQASGFASGHA